MTRIALVHATPVAMEPIADAFARSWPAAVIFNLLEDALSPDLQRNSGIIDASFHRRFAALTRYAVEDAHADAILFTCSAFGPAIDQVVPTCPVPVLKPNEAMFEAAIASGKRIGMLATLREAISPMEDEFRELAARHAPQAVIESAWVEGAMQALVAGRKEEHDFLLAEAAPRLGRCDTVMLAHFSTTRAKDAIAARIAAPVLTSPDSAVAKLKRVLTTRAGVSPDMHRPSPCS